MLRHMRTLATLSFACAAPLALVACGDKEAGNEDLGNGELLPRSVTDDMLPYDTVRSQGPLVAPTSASTVGERAVNATTAESTEAAPENPEAATEATAADEEQTENSGEAE
jgi:hypothetical protein